MPNTDRYGQCYGGGMIGLSIAGDSVRTGECPVCGRRIGICNGNGSQRITAHKPPEKDQRYFDRIRRLAARFNVAEWLHRERAEYADFKYAETTESRHKLVVDLQNYGLSGEWMVFVGNYLKRVELFGLDTPQGRQALGKLIVTLTHALETSVEVCGPMPAPGVPSGELLEWLHGDKAATDGPTPWVRTRERDHA